jgi:hypothetical protein
MVEITPEYMPYIGIAQTYVMAYAGARAAELIENLAWKFKTRNLPKNTLEKEVEKS